MRAARLVAGLVTVVAACSNATTAIPDQTTVVDPASTSASNTDSTRLDEAITTITTPSPIETGASTTSIAAGPPSTATTTTVAALPSAPGCRPSDDVLITPSGRRVLLRAGGLPGPSPTIVVVHGYTGSPSGIERFAELTDVANSHGIAVAYPEGGPTDQGGFGWNTGAQVFATTAGDDVAAIGEMLDVLSSTGCVDSGRVTIVGESNGGGMAIIAACSPQLARRFTRVVVVNAAVDEGVLARCASAAGPTPLTAIGGSLDETVPVLGTAQLLPAADWFAVASSTIAGCRAVDPVDVVDAVVSRAVGTGCAGCSELLVVADGTHTWPGVSRGVSGLTPGTFDLNALLISAALATSTGCLTGLP